MLSGSLIVGSITISTSSGEILGPDPIVQNQDANATGGPAAPEIGPLTSEDAAHYKAIFALQATASWAAADRDIAALGDKVLMPSVLSQRYLSGRYSASFAQAFSWLQHYPRHPETPAIWALALNRGTRREVAALRQPAIFSEPAPIPRVFPPSPGDLQRPRAFALGMVAWREGRLHDAAHDFEAVAKTKSMNGWFVAAGAYWAARAWTKLNEPVEAAKWLELAAGQPRTFYGFVARAAINPTPIATASGIELSPADVARLSLVPGGKRALALAQIGQVARAQDELCILARQASGPLLGAVKALSASLGNAIEDVQDATALYPMPHWRPRKGFSVDRALLYAVMREESGFDAGALSDAGARGLMQLMPETARQVALSIGIAYRGGDDLKDPVTNMSLGQEYVKQLIDQDEVKGNLILLLATYNTGPVPVHKWLSEPSVKNDPIAFIEAMPRLDTRLYVQRVLTNYWSYRQRLGQPLPDLTELATNHWPTYLSIDPSTIVPPQYASSR